MQEFKLPSLGADMDEGTLVVWKIQPGDRVRRGDVVAVVDTSKAAIDVESWQEGTVQELRVQPGDKFPVGTVMAILDTGAEAARPASGDGFPKAQAATVAPGARLRISPAARKRAAGLGIDPLTLQGSGAGGSITLQDVETARSAATSPAAAPAAVTAPAIAMRDRGVDMRRTIAAVMSRSKREIPHYYLAQTIVLAKALDWLHAWNAARPVTERVLLSALLLKAVARALHEHPRLNGFYANDSFEAATAVHVGVAIALRSGGLVAPALLDVDSRPLGVLMQTLNDLVQRTRAGSLRSSELSFATITVTNLGEQSVEDVFGVIYPPQVALVGFGGVHQQVVPIDGGIGSVPVLRATLAADHRVSDGHYGARFLQRLAALLQDPASLAGETAA